MTLCPIMFPEVRIFLLAFLQYCSLCPSALAVAYKFAVRAKDLLHGNQIIFSFFFSKQLHRWYFLPPLRGIEGIECLLVGQWVSVQVVSWVVLTLSQESLIAFSIPRTALCSGLAFYIHPRSPSPLNGGKSI